MRTSIASKLPVVGQQPQAFPKNETPKFATRQGLPFSVAFHNNDVLNRSFIETFGLMPSGMVVARNVDERLEVAWVSVPWLLFAIAGPIILEKRINHRSEEGFRKDFAKYFGKKPVFKQHSKGWFNRLHHRIANLGRTSPLRVPWGALNGSGIQSISPEKAKQLVKDVGFKSVESLKTALQDKAFTKRLLRSKMRILALDVSLMAFTNLLSSWGKKIMTEKVSGRKGFSGEFSYGTEAFLEEKSKQYEKNKRKNFLTSVFSVLAVDAVLLPVILLGVKSKGKTLLGKGLRKLNKAFDYNNGIFMSKWLVAWGGFAGWMLAEVLSARDNHERRESIIKIGTMVATYTAGDDLFGGLFAKLRQKKQWKVPIVERGWLGLPALKKLNRVYNAVQGNTKHVAYKGAKQASWFGLLSATALTGLVSPLLNNWYTHKKASAEQEAFAQKYMGLFKQPLLTN